MMIVIIEGIKDRKDGKYELDNSYCSFLCHLRFAIDVWNLLGASWKKKLIGTRKKESQNLKRKWKVWRKNDL